MAHAKKKGRTVGRLVAETHGMVREILDQMRGRRRKGRVRVQLVGTRRRQFDAVVLLERTRAEPDLWNSCWFAWRRVRGTKEDPGYPNFQSLYRYANKKRAFIEERLD